MEIDKFFELENAGTTKDDNSDAAQWLRAIKAIVKEESAPEKILQNETFQKLMDSVKLINFAEELFNVEVKNMTDLQAEHEEGLAEGRELGFADGKTEGFAAGEKAERAKADKEKRDIAKGLREDGVPMDVIIRRTGFSKEEIESL